MSARRPKLAKNRIEEAVRKYFLMAPALGEVSQGEESQVYRFACEGCGYVVRVNRSEEGFRKDDFCYRHFSRRELPIPKVLHIGDLDGYAFCISEEMPGVTLQDLPHEALPAIVGEVARAHEAVAAINVDSISGYGMFNHEGHAPFASWREFLTSIGDASRYDWPHVKNVCGAADLDSMLSEVTMLAERMPEVHALVHGDFGSNNILMDGERVTGVLDWSEATVGDPLFDVANVFFWRTWLECMEQQARYYETEALRAANADRLRCYQLRIGLEELYHEAMEGDAEMARWCANRCREIMGTAR